MIKEIEISYVIFTTLCTIWAIIYGMIGPYYIIKMNKISNEVEVIGFAMGFTVLMRSATSYLVGKLSDKVGRRPLLICAVILDAIIMILYTMITKGYQLYVMQAVIGITSGITETLKITMLGDITVKEGRGGLVGKYNAMLGIGSAMGLILSGFISKYYGIDSVFYICSISLAISVLFLKNNEENSKNLTPNQLAKKEILNEV